MVTFRIRVARNALALAALGCVVTLIPGSVSTAAAGQAPAGSGTAKPGPSFPRVALTTGKSTMVETTFDVTRIAVTDPRIADAVVVRPREILIDGKAPGTISLIVWGADTRIQYDVVVEQPISSLEQQLHLLFPGESIQVSVNADAIILSGKVSSTEVMLRAAEVARASGAKANVINMLQVPGAAESQQVMLAVRFAEVNRRALDGSRRQFLHRRHGVQELDRSNDNAAVSGAGYRWLGVGLQ